MSDLNIKKVDFDKLAKDINLDDLIDPKTDFNAYMVTTGWQDAADSTSTSKDFLVTNWSEPVLGKLVHDALDLSWFDCDHGYDRSWYSGFDLTPYNFFSGWDKENPWHNLLNDLNKIDEDNDTYNSSTYINHFDIIWVKFENDRPVIYFAQTEVVRDTVASLTKARENYNKEQAKLKRQKEASAKLSGIIETIKEMPQKDKEKVLKSLFK